jgi:TPR repeat protein
MRCRLCKWLCDRFCEPGVGSDEDWREFWRVSQGWEQDHSNEWDQWVADSAEVQARNERTVEVFKTDRSLAFDLRKELADNGSVWAMRLIGQHFERGWGVERDLAQAEHYYYRAQLAGSWMATLDLADLLFSHRINERWVGILENGVESGFIPSSFWLAHYRYKRDPRRQMARDVRPLLETAANAGHPGARMTLARWRAQGKYGLREIQGGFREFRSLWADFRGGRLRDYAAKPDGA